MAVEYELSAQKREVGSKKINELRKKGFIPSVVYGKGKENLNIAVGENEFYKVFNKAGENSLIALNVDGETKPRNVLVYGVQYDPVRDDALHVDFYEVKMDEAVEAEVPLVFVGESPAVKELGGTLITNKYTVLIKSLPINIPKEIEVSIEKLKTFEDSILASDVEIPSDVELITDEEETIAFVNEPRSEEELAELEEDVEADVESVGDVEEEKGEGEEGEEKQEEEEEEKGE